MAHVCWWSFSTVWLIYLLQVYSIFIVVEKHMVMQAVAQRFLLLLFYDFKIQLTLSNMVNYVHVVANNNKLLLAVLLLPTSIIMLNYI